MLHIFLFRNLELFNDAFDLANPPPGGNETDPQLGERILKYVKAMNAKYGTRWLDTFLDETSFYYLDDPEAFAENFLSRLFPCCNHTVNLLVSVLNVASYCLMHQSVTFNFQFALGMKLSDITSDIAF